MGCEMGRTKFLHAFPQNQVLDPENHLDALLDGWHKVSNWPLFWSSGCYFF